MWCDSFPPVDLDVELVASRVCKEEVMAVPSQKKKVGLDAISSAHSSIIKKLWEYFKFFKGRKEQLLLILEMLQGE